MKMTIFKVSAIGLTLLLSANVASADCAPFEKNFSPARIFSSGSFETGGTFLKLDTVKVVQLSSCTKVVYYKGLSAICNNVTGWPWSASALKMVDYYQNPKGCYLRFSYS